MPATRTATYRRRMQEKGYRQLAVWIDTDAAAALDALHTMEPVTINALVSAALKHYHAARQRPAGRAQARTDRRSAESAP